MEVLSNHVARHEMSQMSEAERLKGLESYAREQWLANRVSFDIPTVVKVSHVLVGKEGREEEEMTRLAEELLQRARNGEDFSKLVQDYSEDRSKHRNNGVIDVTEQGDLVESFKLAAFALTPEAPLSGLVETSYGLHILKLEERTEGQERSFDEVKGSLMDAMARRYDERRKQLLLSRLRADEPAHDEEAIGKYLDSLAARLRQMEPVAAEQP
jgi:parvulin-like peptidyl-prolyl isomerase